VASVERQVHLPGSRLTDAERTLHDIEGDSAPLDRPIADRGDDAHDGVNLPRISEGEPYGRTVIINGQVPNRAHARRAELAGGLMEEDGTTEFFSRLRRCPTDGRPESAGAVVINFKGQYTVAERCTP